MIKYSDVLDAKNRIDKYIYKTPLIKSGVLSNEHRNVYLKLDNQQNQRCTKLRGAFSKLTSLSENDIKKGISVVSSGNHGIAISYAASVLGIDNVNVYIPKPTPKTKVDKIKSFGVNIHLIGENYDEAYSIGKSIIAEKGELFIDSSSDVEVIAGQGTAGIETFEDLSDIDVVLVPIGGGGILTGISLAAKHFNPQVEVIGVQTAACPAMVAAVRDNVFYGEYPTEDSICESLVGGVGDIPFEMAKECIDDFLVVEEEDIKKAIKLLALEEKTIAEAGGAISVGALIINPELFKGKNVVAVITGGNIDKELLEDIICSK
ncbi:MAG: pyridoxal-phosphate dependent enzyme [Tissierellia bacterium]|nr:pyridoxal-phosphate dependent enzyme [Tissierellia bacterium]